MEKPFSLAKRLDCMARDVNISHATKSLPARGRFSSLLDLMSEVISLRERVAQAELERPPVVLEIVHIDERYPVRQAE